MHAWVQSYVYSLVDMCATVPVIASSYITCTCTFIVVICLCCASNVHIIAIPGVHAYLM